MTQHDRQQFKNSLIQSTKYFKIKLENEPIFNWNDTAVGSKAITSEGKTVWLRIQCGNCDDIKNNHTWSGEIDASSLENILKSNLIDYYNWQDKDVCWRALLLSYIDENFCSTHPILTDSKFLLSVKWLDELKKNLVVLSKYKTNRISITQEDVDKKIKKTFNIQVDTTITNWVTIHGDLHLANLTYPSLYILDWEVWGNGPLGYDPALLLAFSADNFDVVDKIREVFKDWLLTREGKIVQLFALAEVLNIAKFDSQFSRLEKPIEQMSKKIMNELVEKN